MQRIISGGYITQYGYRDNVAYQSYDALFYYSTDITLKIWHEYDTIINDEYGSNVQFGERIIEETGMYLWLDGSRNPTPQIIYGRGDRNGSNQGISYAGEFIDRNTQISSYGPRSGGIGSSVSNSINFVNLSKSDEAKLKKSPYDNPYKGNTPQERKCWLYDSIDYFEVSLKYTADELQSSINWYEIAYGSDATTQTALNTIAIVTTTLNPVFGFLVKGIATANNFFNKQKTTADKERIIELTAKLKKEVADYNLAKEELIDLEAKYGKGCETTSNDVGTTKLSTAQIVVIVLFLFLLLILIWRYFRR